MQRGTHNGQEWPDAWVARRSKTEMSGRAAAGPADRIPNPYIHIICIQLHTNSVPLQGPNLIVNGQVYDDHVGVLELVHPIDPHVDVAGPHAHVPYDNLPVIPAGGQDVCEARGPPLPSQQGIGEPISSQGIYEN